MLVLTKEQLLDILQGAGVLAACGGGLVEESLQYVTLIRDAPYSPTLVTLHSLSEHTNVFTPFIFGNVENTETYEGKSSAASRLLRAVQLAQSNRKQPFGAIVPVEAGSLNMAVALYISAMTNIPVVDADPRGRSVPEIGQSVWALNGVPVGTVIAVTNRDEEVILHNVASDAREDTLLRAILPLTDNRMSCVDHVIQLGQMRGSLIPNTVSKCLQLGRHLRQGRANIAISLAEKFDGKVLFTGIISKFRTWIEKGCSKGLLSIADGDEVMVLHLINECMYADLNGDIVASVPEIISVIDVDNRQVQLNPNFVIGCKVAVIVLPSPQPYLTPAGLDMLGPKYVGINWTFKSALE